MLELWSSVLGQAIMERRHGHLPPLWCAKLKWGRTMPEAPTGRATPDGSPSTPAELRIAARALAGRLDWPPARSGYLFVRSLGQILQDERVYEGSQYPPHGLWEWRHRNLVLTPDGVACVVSEGVGLARDVGTGRVVEAATDGDLVNAGGTEFVNHYRWEDGTQVLRSWRTDGDQETGVRDTWVLVQRGELAADADGDYYPTRYYQQEIEAGSKPRVKSSSRSSLVWILALLLTFLLVLLAVWATRGS